LNSAAVKSTGQYYQQLIFGPNATLYLAHQLYILRCVMLTLKAVVSSLKRFISRFLLRFVYLKEF